MMTERADVVSHTPFYRHCRSYFWTGRDALF
jgi:hypothetical protein